jgi:hypothetical protein
MSRFGAGSGQTRHHAELASARTLAALSGRHRPLTRPADRGGHECSGRGRRKGGRGQVLANARSADARTRPSCGVQSSAWTRGRERRRQQAERQASGQWGRRRNRDAGWSQTSRWPGGRRDGAGHCSAQAMKAAGAGGGIDLLRAQVFIGTLNASHPAAPGGSRGSVRRSRPMMDRATGPGSGPGDESPGSDGPRDEWHPPANRARPGWRSHMSRQKPAGHRATTDPGRRRPGTIRYQGQRQTGRPKRNRQLEQAGRPRPSGDQRRDAIPQLGAKQQTGIPRRAGPNSEPQDHGRAGTSRRLGDRGRAGTSRRPRYRSGAGNSARPGERGRPGDRGSQRQPVARITGA